MNSIHGVDLNLLVAFDAIVSERGVTAAARKANVTQSAMSHTLRRLRALFGDELLVNGRLTPRAQALAVPVRGALVNVERVLQGPRPFEPQTAKRVFRIVAPDLFESLALPGLLRALPPGIDLVVAPMTATLADRLETGEVDVGIVPMLLDGQAFEPGAQAPALQRKTVLKDGFRCFTRRKRKLTLKQYMAADHLLVSPTGDGPGIVDKRRIRLRVPHFATALDIIERTDLVLTAPAALRNMTRLFSFEAPMKLPEHAIALVWHPRFSDDPAHTWLRGQLERSVRQPRLA